MPAHIMHADAVLQRAAIEDAGQTAFQHVRGDAPGRSGARIGVYNPRKRARQRHHHDEDNGDQP